MKAPYRIPTIVLVMLAGMVLAGGLGWYVYALVRQPKLERDGGTILTYELDEDRLPDSYRPEDMAAAIKRRVDPDGRAGLTVQSLPHDRFEVAIPRGRNHAAQVTRVKELLARVGLLEFLILANQLDDREAFAAADKYFAEAQKKPESKEQLETYAARGRAPPFPNPAGGLKARLGQFTYRWLELGPGVRELFGLGKRAPRQHGENQAEDDEREPFWCRQAAEARSRTEPLVFEVCGRALLFSRDCRDQNLSPEERAGKQFDYFFLAREAETDPQTGASAAVTGRDLAGVLVADNANRAPSIYFKLTKEGGDRFYDLTSGNAPDASEPPFTRYLAAVIDGQILTAPRLNGAIGAEGVIEGRFTPAEAERLATMLRAGALPARLRPLPVAEVTVEPGSTGNH